MIAHLNARLTLLLRYGLVSIINIALGQGLLLVGYRVMRWSVVVANVFATAVAAGPAYMLSRRWVWRVTTKSHVLQEVLPFWGLMLAGLGLSVASADSLRAVAPRLIQDRAGATIVVLGGALVAYGVIWIARFVVLDRYMFAEHGATGVARFNWVVEGNRDD